MRVTNTLVLNEAKSLREQVRDLQVALRTIYTLAHGRISFGTGVDGDKGQNIEGEWQEFTVSAGADTEFNLAHTLGSIPLGYIVVAQDKAGQLYQMDDTGTAWTASQISLKSTVDAVTYLIFLIKKGQTNV